MKIEEFHLNNVSDLLSSADQIHSLLMENKAVVIKSADLEMDEQAELMRAVYLNESNDRNVNSDYMAGHFHAGQLKYGPESSEDELLRYIYSNWHVDESPVSDPAVTIPCLISMNMKIFNCPNTFGKTLFVDREKMFEDMPDELRERLNGYNIVSLSGGPGRDEDIYKNSLLDSDSKPIAMDHDGVMWSARNYPIYSTHPVTRRTALTALSAFSNRLISADARLSLDYCVYVSEYLKDESNWVTWSWSVDDLLLWDNRSLIHSYSGGWIEGERLFNRSNIGEQKLYYERVL